jgi:hypothetical protein
MENSNLVWYVAYGSNLLEARFLIYVCGGVFKENNSSKSGCSDKTPPHSNRPFIIPHPVYFANKSGSWENQGVAFLDYTLPGRSLGRAWLITEKQLMEIQKQEGDSMMWYGHSVILGEDENGIKCKTFTQRVRQQHNRPCETYLRVIERGIRETYPDISDREIKRYIEDITKCEMVTK